jgi:hypothetical protein
MAWKARRLAETWPCEKPPLQIFATARRDGKNRLHYSEIPRERRRANGRNQTLVIEMQLLEIAP